MTTQRDDVLDRVAGLLEPPRKPSRTSIAGCDGATDRQVGA